MNKWSKTGERCDREMNRACVKWGWGFVVFWFVFSSFFAGNDMKVKATSFHLPSWLQQLLIPPERRTHAHQPTPIPSKISVPSFFSPLHLSSFPPLLLSRRSGSIHTRHRQHRGAAQHHRHDDDDDDDEDAEEREARTGHTHILGRVLNGSTLNMKCAT